MLKRLASTAQQRDICQANIWAFVKQIFDTDLIYKSFMLLQNTIMATPSAEDAFN